MKYIELQLHFQSYIHSVIILQHSCMVHDLQHHTPYTRTNSPAPITSLLPIKLYPRLMNDTLVISLIKLITTKYSML